MDSSNLAQSHFASIVIPLLLLSLTPPTHAQAQSLPAKPLPAEEGARSTIERYFQAHALGDGNVIRQIFTPDAKVRFVENGQEKQWTIEEYATRFQGPAADEYRRVRRVDQLVVSGSAASAVLTLDYPQVIFTDHMSLLKIGEEWKIVSKLFSANRRDAGQEAMQETLSKRSLPFEPRRILGNIYYVGTNLISSFLIVTPGGHILLDTGHLQMLPQVLSNIQKLGFRPEDVKILLNSHAHFDHCGAFAEMKRRTGAKLFASKPDGELMMRGGRGDFFWGDDAAYEPVTPDRTLADGDHVELAGVRLTAHLTPGHTQGCTSWTMQVNEGGRDYDVLFACALTASLYKLHNNPRYPDIVKDVRGSLQKLGGMRADVLLAPHGFYFDLERKAARQMNGKPNPFIDPGELGRHLGEVKKNFEEALRSQERQR